MASSFTLGSHYESFIRGLVKSGRYASASEVVRDSLRLMEEREKLQAAKLEALRRDIQAGLASGPSTELDMTEIKASARQERLRRKTGSAHGAE